MHLEGEIAGVVSVALLYNADRGSALDLFSEFACPAYDCAHCLVNVLPSGLQTLNLGEDYKQGFQNLKLSCHLKVGLARRRVKEHGYA